MTFVRAVTVLGCNCKVDHVTRSPRLFLLVVNRLKYIFFYFYFLFLFFCQWVIRFRFSRIFEAIFDSFSMEKNSTFFPVNFRNILIERCNNFFFYVLKFNKQIEGKNNKKQIIVSRHIFLKFMKFV